MESILQALGGILLRALPTFILVILLHFYLKHMFFGPLEKVLHRRYELSEGARTAAEQSLQRAAAKVEEYESALRAARAEIFQGQEETHRQLQSEHEQAVREARSEVEAAIQQAKAELESDVDSAKRDLQGQSDTLAEQITSAILAGRAA
jgi:F-type H+-transporting ATPase subunit b